MMKSLYLAFLFLLIFATGCGNRSGSSKRNTTWSISDHESITQEEAMTRATHVVTATLIESVKHNGAIEYCFQPNQVLKGNLAEEDNDTIHVQIEDDEDGSLKEWFVKNEIYLLCLEKYVSVYYEHNVYVSIGPVVSSMDGNWRELLVLANRISSQAVDDLPTQYGNPYIKSSEPSDLIEFADNIFMVTVDGIYAEGSQNCPTNVYQCTVNRAIRSDRNTVQSILLTAWKDSVLVGEQYIVFLADSTKTTPVYTLASKEGSIYSLDDAKQIEYIAKVIEGEN